MAPHQPRAGEFRGSQPRTPKEQYLSVNLSGTRTAPALMPLESGDALRGCTRPWGKAPQVIAVPNLSGARAGQTTEGEDTNTLAVV
ncbi:hypothetical protein MMIN_35720 [Mycolicibacter minnesotensis]|nr:hypothetical protein MMIN_35720 [Mycolicibacter minnesotensis]